MRQTLFLKEDIRPTLVKYLTAAKSSIHMAIGWLEDIGLMGLLEKKRLEGVAVKILVVNENQSEKTINKFKQLSQKTAVIIYLDEDYKEHLIDHRFVVIDGRLIFTGNYAWGYRQAPAEENIILTEGLPTMAAGYEQEFDYLCIVNQLSQREEKPVNPITDLLKKLNVVKVLLGIGDTDFIDLRLKGMQSYRSDENIALMFDSIEQKKYEEAFVLVKEFTSYHQPLLDCIDPPLDKLRREIQRIEEEITEISNEYNETQKTLHRFSKLHSEHLGDLLQKILLQNKIKAARESAVDPSKQEDYEEAKKDHEDYTKSYKISKQIKLASLTSSEQKELKKLYRQTSLKCHPDRVIEELYEEAERIFVALNQAYKANDLQEVRAIHQQLKTGIMLAKSEGITELKKLESTVNSLSKKLDDWLEKLLELQAIPSFRTVSKIDDWETYFLETKEVLEQQLTRLEWENEEE